MINAMTVNKKIGKSSYSTLKKKNVKFSNFNINSIILKKKKKLCFSPKKTQTLFLVLVDKLIFIKTLASQLIND